MNDLYRLSRKKATNTMIDYYESINLKRKYTNDPYWWHVYSVAQLAEKHIREHTNVEAIIYGVYLARLGHDLLEDVAPKYPHDFIRADIQSNFGSLVSTLIHELTDVYTKESYPELNRAARKTLEAQRLSKISTPAKIIKLADLYDNTKSIVQHDREFALIYLREKGQILNLFSFDKSVSQNTLFELCDQEFKVSCNLIYDT